MVNLLFVEDTKALTGQRPVRTLYDPACGTGGMLSIAQEYLHDLNPNIVLEVFGQELNDETWAVSRSDLMIKGQDPTRIAFGNSLTNQDGHAGSKFDYCISNPPYGDDWKKFAEEVNKEASEKGFDGRYGAGLPRVSDGSFLFLQHMISKMKPVNDDPDTPDIIEGGSRIAVLLSGSPLFSGQAGSGESEIRRWIIENDWLEGLVAMPDSMFYNTGIGTYIWIINNRKKENAKGFVKLLDARDMGTKMRKSLGDKRKELTNDAIAEITRIYDDASGRKGEARVKVMRNEEFGYARLTIERPLRRVWRLDEVALLSCPAAIRSKLETMKHATFADQKDAETALVKAGLAGKEIAVGLKALATTDPTAMPSIDKKGVLEADSDLRDSENISLPKGFIEMDGKKQESVIAKLAQEHLVKEIHPYVLDAWIDHSKTKIGYEIPFTRQFYVYTPPRPVTEIRSEIESLERQIQDLMTDLA
jgi:type I restriction enzyme M protein